MYIIYKTTNDINGKIYVGYHYTKNINDSYIGSGKLLKLAIKKYGKENFSKKILYQIDTIEEALRIEFKIVNKLFIENKNTYNIKIGGEGGWNFINNKKKIDKKFTKEISKKAANTLTNRYSNGKLKRTAWNKGLPAWNKGLKISNETKLKISKNNGNKLDEKEIKKRLNDFNEIDKNRGYITKLSKIWNISHAQVRRFITKHVK